MFGLLFIRIDNVFVNDLVKVQAKINELVVLLDWNITNNRDVTFTSLGHSLAPTAGVIEFEFVAVSPGEVSSRGIFHVYTTINL